MAEYALGDEVLDRLDAYVRRLLMANQPEVQLIVMHPYQIDDTVEIELTFIYRNPNKPARYTKLYCSAWTFQSAYLPELHIAEGLRNQKHGLRIPSIKP